MSVLLINYNPSGLYNRNEILNCLIIAAELKRHNIDYRIIEVSKEKEYIKIKERFVVITSREEKVQHFAEEIRRRNKNTVMFFFHEYFSYFIKKEFLDIVDLVIVGNGFKCIIDIVKDLNRKDSGIKSCAWSGCEVIHVNESENPIDLKKSGPLPYSDYPGNAIYKEAAFKDSPFEEGKDTGLIYFSRGCVKRCEFCINPVFYKRKVFFRNEEDVVADIEFFIKKGIRYLSFEDENFIADRKRIDKLLKMIREKKFDIRYRCHAAVKDIDDSILEKLSKSGCERLDIGVETASIDIQSKIKKINGVDRVLKLCEKIKRSGIRPYILMIIGFPGEKKEDLLKTEEFLETLKKNDIEFGLSLFRPLPGTKYENIEGLTGSSFSSHGKDILHYKGTETDLEQLKRIYKRFTSKKIIYSEQIEKIEINKDQANYIGAQEYVEAEFEPVPLNIWKGDKWDEKSPAHIVGRFKGFIRYKIYSKEDYESDIYMKFRACSQTEKKGEIRVDINGISKEITLPEKSETGEVLSVYLKSVAVKKVNLLTIDCSSNEGLSLFLSLDLSKNYNKSIEISVCDML